MAVEPVKQYDRDRYPELKEHFSLRNMVFNKWTLLSTLMALGALMEGCNGPS